MAGSLSRCRPRSALRPVPGGEDDLGRRIGADAELAGNLVRPESLLVVDEREPLLLPGPRAAGRWGRTLRLSTAGRPPGRLGGGGSGWGPRHGNGGAERAAPLVTVLAAGQFVAGALIEDHDLVGRLVHPHGHHGQALRVFLLALTGHAVVVFPRSFGMQFSPACNALCHYLFL